MKYSILILMFASFSAFADVDVYKSNDNTGLNKLERIDSMESYLTSLSTSINKMQASLDSNADKVKSLSKIIDNIKSEFDKKSLQKVGEAIESKADPELTKLKAEIESLKSTDIEKVKTELTSLSNAVKLMQFDLENNYVKKTVK